jgi:hypothetical protein
MRLSDYVSPNYAHARARFLKSAEKAGAELFSQQHPLRGPAGEKLFCDAAWIGPRDAEKVFVTISATHGVEGFCGSMCQSAWLGEGMAQRSTDVKIAHLAIHALNPYGFAWIRRVNEDNVDLNRNFVDFSKPLPVNENYRLLHAAICPSDWSEATEAAYEAAIAQFKAEKGDLAYRMAVSGGQYEFADGIFFGGQAPTWSHRALRAIFHKLLAQAKAIGVVDFHSGLGPFGYGEIIEGNAPKDRDTWRMKEWFGDQVTFEEDGTASSAPMVGTNGTGMRRFAPDAVLVKVALEYGTHPHPRMRRALRHDNWLHMHGDLNSAEASAIKAEIRECYGPDDAKWRELVWTRAIEVSDMTIAGLRTV